jgi:hypothetical protein
MEYRRNEKTAGYNQPTLVTRKQIKMGSFPRKIQINKMI